MVIVLHHMYLLSERKDGFLHIFKEVKISKDNGAYGSVRKQIEGFESGKGASVSLPTGFF